MREISQTEKSLLINKGILFYGANGFKDKNGNYVGHYRGRSGGKSFFIEDKFADIARNLRENKA